jgi:hypothetical protein
MSVNQPDPWDAAGNADQRVLFGQVSLNVWFCALVKGKGKVPYDEKIHERRATAIDLIITPLADARSTYNTERSMIAESNEWGRIVLPSIKAAGILSVREANGKWCQYTLVSTGETYRAQRGAHAGEERERTTVKFLKFYNSEDECRSAYYAARGSAGEDVPDVEETPMPGFEPQAQAQPTANANGNSRMLETAKLFIAAFAKQNGYDIEKTRAVCRTQPMITNAIDVDSDTFVALIAEALSKAA